MVIYKAKDYQDMSRKAANIISAQIIMKPNCVLGLATGSSPVGTYKQLIEWYKKGDLDFSQVTSVNLSEYNEIIRKQGGVDLQLLGLGHNGHIGFNEPGAAFEKETHCVDLTESTIEANKRFFESEDDVPRQAYTMGIKNIMQAKKILVVVSGEDKAAILKEVLYGPITPEVPAIVADASALSKINM